MTAGIEREFRNEVLGRCVAADSVAPLQEG
jgi:hypothetical protein